MAVGRRRPMVRTLLNTGVCMCMAIKVLLADGHKILAQGLASLLTEQAGYEIVGIAKTGEEAVEFAERLIPDVVVMEVTLPGLDSTVAVRQILSKLPDVGILGLSHHRSARFVRRMLQAGARGYVLKKCTLAELTKAIRTVGSGIRYLGAGVEIPTDGADKSHSGSGEDAPVLSERECQVLRLVSEGKSNAHIASVLGLSPHTVVRHRQNIMDKTDLHSIAELTLFAIREHIAVI